MSDELPCASEMLQRIQNKQIEAGEKFAQKVLEAFNRNMTPAVTMTVTQAEEDYIESIKIYLVNKGCPIAPNLLISPNKV